MRSPRNSYVEALPSLCVQVGQKTEVLAKADTVHSIPCLRCGECCRRYQVCLDLVEAELIAGELGLALEAFRDRYADHRWPARRSILLRQEHGCCPFLQRSGESSDELCLIHPFKPFSCRQWTPGLDRAECQAGLARRWGVEVNSDGELEGPSERMRDLDSYLSGLIG